MVIAIGGGITFVCMYMVNHSIRKATIVKNTIM
jgi:hypothetical protein